MKEECLICKAPLEYLEHGEMMECVICHKKEESRARCVNAHYVCNECHTKGIDVMVGTCLSETSKDPFVIFERLVSLPFCHMHGPEHHSLAGASLLTAYKNAGGDIDLEAALAEMQKRGSEVPGGICGFWGTCGAAVSSGIFLSIITKATPLSKEEWGLSNRMTSRSLAAIGEVGGPRCCKRNAYLAITEAVRFVEENLGIHMESHKVLCSHSSENNQCLGKKCPFNKNRSDL
ncbi:MAG: SAM-dependent methyltransferase [Coprococcus sp.]|nr:SAM-dependent methyltransferase [Coprococcus sp.]